MARRFVLVLGLLLASIPVVEGTFAHPGHEYKISGTVSKVRSQQFEVTESDGTRTTFFIVAATEILMGTRRGTAADIKVGASTTAEGVENDKGMIEARVVRMAVAKQ